MDAFSFLGDWSHHGRPLHAALGSSIRGAIERGELPAGTRLPPERALARLLGVSRNTVVAAYDGLRADGWLRRRQGSGTFVERRAAVGREGDRRAAVQSAYLARPSAAASGVVDLATASPSAYDAVPADVFAAAAADLHEATLSDGHLPYGLPALREAIAGRLTAARLPTSPDEILVTTGAQQGLSLAVALLVRPGDRVVVEDPTYPGALDALRQADATLAPLPVDGEGGDIDALPGLLERGAARALYLCSTFHSPTGVLLSERRRRDLARIADQRRLAVVDDVALADTSLAVGVPPPLAAYAPEAPILTVGSLSKILWGGLRVGWIRASRPLVERLARLKVVADHGSSVLSQILAARLLAGVDDRIALRRAEANERLDRLGALLAGALPEWSFDRPAGGLVVWIRLPRGEATEFGQLALRHGVVVVPGSVAAAQPGPSAHLRLPFGLDAHVAEEAVARLAAAWAAYEPAPGTGDRLRVID